MLKKHPLGRSVNIVGNSMIVYSVLNAAEYYAERGNLGMPVVFGLLCFLSIFIIGVLILKGTLQDSTKAVS